VRRKDGNFATGVLHLWHSQADRSSMRENSDRLAQIERAGRVQANVGLSRLVREDDRAAPLSVADLG
jgi:hypothetical protein